MSSPFVAEIRMFAGNFAPKGWASCNGQLLPISQNTALFSLLGTTYGGDGKSTFALPDLAGSAAMGSGQDLGCRKDFWERPAVAKPLLCFKRKCPCIPTWLIAITGLAINQARQTISGQSHTLARPLIMSTRQGLAIPK